MNILDSDIVSPKNLLFLISSEHDKKVLKNNLIRLFGLYGFQHWRQAQLVIAILEMLEHSDGRMEFYRNTQYLAWVCHVAPEYEKMLQSIVETKIISQDTDDKVKILCGISFTYNLQPDQGELKNVIGCLEQNLEEKIFLELKQKQVLSQQSRQAQMGEMISMIAHQWRQPLAAIASTAIDMKLSIRMDSYDLEDKASRNAFLQYYYTSLDEIELFVKNLTTTVDDFRTFNKPDKEVSEVHIHKAAEKAVQIIAHILESKGIVLQTDFKSSNRVDIYLNEMMQVVLNIIKNAQDNFEERSIENPVIRITSKDMDSGACLEICDNGGGIPENIISRVFEAYYSTKNEKNGTGLGLYMSKMIVDEHHKGFINVENRQGGACFTIMIRH